MRVGKWETLRELGKGGQGVAHLALDTTKFDLDKMLSDLRGHLGYLTGAGLAAANREHALSLLGDIEKYLGREAPAYSGALKILHDPIKNDPKALARLAAEIEALTDIHHPNLIPLLDSSAADAWLVTAYQPHGTLANHIGRFAGQPIKALEHLRPLIDGVARLHQNGYIHRDIKPENIFSSDAGLVLGDFGIVYFEDEAKTRVSDKYENVGSRDWMPGWAMGMRVDDVRPSFDVFSLGKVLWAMISGRDKMRLWYFDHDEFNLEKLFPADERMRSINLLLRGCVVEREEACWPTATHLLEQVDGLLVALRRSGQVIGRGVKRYCLVCGRGYYADILTERSGPEAFRNFGIDPRGPIFRIAECGVCGHIQIFRIDRNPPAWRE